MTNKMKLASSCGTAKLFQKYVVIEAASQKLVKYLRIYKAKSSRTIFLLKSLNYPNLYFAVWTFYSLFCVIVRWKFNDRDLERNILQYLSLLCMANTKQSHGIKKKQLGFNEKILLKCCLRRQFYQAHRYATMVLILRITIIAIRTQQFDRWNLNNNKYAVIIKVTV